MAYISPGEYSNEQRSFIFRKGESEKKRHERRITRAFFNCFSSHPKIRQGRNYYFLKALLEMSQESYSGGLFTEDFVAKAVKSATKRDGLRNFDYRESLEWAVKAGYVNEQYMLHFDDERDVWALRGRELNYGDAATLSGYSINQKNVAMLLKYQKARAEMMLGLFYEGNKGLKGTLTDIIVTLFKKK